MSLDIDTLYCKLTTRGSSSIDHVLLLLQCFTHRYLGWKINVLDSCDSAGSQGAASEPVPSQVAAPDQVQGEQGDTKHVEDPAVAEDGDLEGKPSIQVETRVKAASNLFPQHDIKGISEDDAELILKGIEKFAAHAKDPLSYEKYPAQVRASEASGDLQGHGDDGEEEEGAGVGESK